MSQRATCWSVTINMKSVSKETADECISRAAQAGWKVEGQLEKGENGTEHYQLMVNTPQTRFTAIKKMFPTAHIEVARKPAALKAYVHKEDTREGDLPAPNEYYPSLAKFWCLLVEHLVPLPQKVVEIGTTKPTPDRRRLEQLDATCRILITNGYHVEGIAVNPSTRSAWNSFASAIIQRTQNEKIRREETDRQTDRQSDVSSESNSINDASQEDTEGEAKCDSQEYCTEDDEDGTCYGDDDCSGQGSSSESGHCFDEGD